jgi:hypothetical protein
MTVNYQRLQVGSRRVERCRMPGAARADNHYIADVFHRRQLLDCEFQNSVQALCGCHLFSEGCEAGGLL